MDILHCDLDAFFASVEQRDHPEWAGKPVVVGASPDSRGVVSTCSYEARQFGIRSAMPSSQAYRLCPQAVFVPPDMPRYKQASREVFHILMEYTPLVEALSIDEAFLELSASHLAFGSSLHIGQQIRRRIKEDLGLPISVGIGPNKFLAKLATSLGKPDGILECNDDLVKNRLPSLPVDYLWGIGAVSTRRLNQVGIYTVQDLLDAPLEQCRSVLGNNTGFILGLARGIDHRPVVPDRTVKSIGNELTFPYDVSAAQTIEQILHQLSSKVARRLRLSKRKACTVTLKLRSPQFQTITRRTTLGSPVDDDQTLYAAACHLYRHSGMEGKPLRLVGIAASQLTDGHLEQLSLFTLPGHGLHPLMDSLNERFSSPVVSWADTLPSSQDSPNSSDLPPPLSKKSYFRQDF